MALPCLLDAARSTSKDCAAALAGKGARDVLASLELLRAVNRAISVEGVPCCLLPSMTCVRDVVDWWTCWSGGRGCVG